jgi:hypothetical protein
MRLHYLVFDSHYYLSGWKPKMPGMVYLVGGVFHPIVGKYALPCGEGTVHVTSREGEGWVSMWTRSSGICYSHPQVAVHGASIRFDYGWYSHVSFTGVSEDLDLRTVQHPTLKISESS